MKEGSRRLKNRWNNNIYDIKITGLHVWKIKPMEVYSLEFGVIKVVKDLK